MVIHRTITFLVIFVKWYLKQDCICPNEFCQTVESVVFLWWSSCLYSNYMNVCLTAGSGNACFVSHI